MKNLEEENKDNRKIIPLTNSEALTFFFIPFRFFGIKNSKNNDFNESELERLKRYGFDLKLKQAGELTLFGRFFYLGIIIVIVYTLR